MYTVTFYSFKGGVGRSMALVNVAYMLARAGRRVLAVDFDLEAPGLCSYAAFHRAQGQPGLVEFVHQYIATDEAPAVDDYITACELDGVPIWLMPAGRHREPSYSSRLNEIDWKALYDNREGFLLMEDLKQQWAEYEGLGFDYVLVDSRTGHTDVGGICTRQLPDAVVVMFVPTPQNVEGLAPIVRAIGAESAPVRDRPVRLHFCPSNVPDLDDEEDILADLLQRAALDLDYAQPAAIIQHYDSLELLLQPVVAQTSSSSRLTRQYEELRRAIVSENLEDREGALIALEQARTGFQKARDDNDRSALERIGVIASQVRALWPEDAAVAWARAALANTRIQPQEELEALSIAIDLGVNAGRARLHRAMVNSSLGNYAAAVADVEGLMSLEAATVFEVAPALQIARSLAPGSVHSLVHAGLLNDRIDAGGKNSLLTSLMTSREGLVETRNVADALLPKLVGRDGFALVENSLMLSLIGLGEFERAIAIPGLDRAALLVKATMVDVFNYAIAEWGLTGTPPADLARRTLELRSETKSPFDANSLQCFALCHWMSGDVKKARVDVEAASAQTSANVVFSCWRYLMVPSEVLKADLAEMASRLASGLSLKPPFIEEVGGAHTP